MPQFNTGEARTAKVTMRNPTSKAFTYKGVLYMGINQATMVEVPFSLGAGESKEVLFAATMPSVAGTYPVYIGVFSNDVLVPPLYRGTEDVVLVVPAPFSMSITKIDSTINKYATAYWLMQPTILVSNPYGTQITHRLRCIAAFGSKDKNLLSSYIFTRCWGGGAKGTPQSQLRELSVTLGPGQSVTIISPYYFIDDWNDNHNSYEWENDPPGMYSAGVKKKYWFRVIDENNNWSPVASIGSA